ncbi:MAG: hypothetical protein BWY85_01234 [Firmicutes bacterium ADurb.Bin506]|nr:MAG: hypothetical protein BWY85_01234 [Firmicutes bacterium ADurb.Bin506]
MHRGGLLALLEGLISCSRRLGGCTFGVLRLLAHIGLRGQDRVKLLLTAGADSTEIGTDGSTHIFELCPDLRRAHLQGLFHLAVALSVKEQLEYLLPVAGVGRQRLPELPLRQHDHLSELPVGKTQQ